MDQKEFGVIVADKNIKTINEYNDLKDGTINMGGIVSLGSSIKYLENIEMNKIKRYILNLNDYLIQSLKELNKEYKRPIIRMITRDMCAVCSNSSLGIVSFNVEGIESLEIAQILSDNNIYVRENNDCMNIQKQSIRVSLGIYNTKQDIDIFIQTLKKIIGYYLQPIIFILLIIILYVLINYCAEFSFWVDGVLPLPFCELFPPGIFGFEPLFCLFP